jgi:hypothetical protein
VKFWLEVSQVRPDLQPKLIVFVVNMRLYLEQDDPALVLQASIV